MLGNLHIFTLKSETRALHFLITVDYFLCTICLAFFLVYSSCVNKNNALVSMVYKTEQGILCICRKKPKALRRAWKEVE